MSTLNVSTRAQIVRFHQFFCSILLLVPEATYILTAFYIDIQRCWLNLWWINFLYFHSMFGFTWFKPTTKAWNSSQHLSASDECHQRHRPSTQPPHQEMGRSNETWRNLTSELIGIDDCNMWCFCVNSHLFFWPLANSILRKTCGLIVCKWISELVWSFPPRPSGVCCHWTGYPTELHWPRSKIAERLSSSAPNSHSWQHEMLIALPSTRRTVNAAFMLINFSIRIWGLGKDLSQVSKASVISALRRPGFDVSGTSEIRSNSMV